MNEPQSGTLPPSPWHLFRGPIGHISLRSKRRTVISGIWLLVVSLVLITAGLAIGRYPVSLGDLPLTLLGRADERLSLVVLEWRLPRIAGALLCGAALAVAGALLQSVTRNPLGSPDLVGLDAGAQTGVLLTIICTGGGSAGIAAGAVGGGVLTALFVGSLSRSANGLPQLRLVVVGIGVSAMLHAVNTWLMLTADLHRALLAAGWRAGSLVEIDASTLAFAAIPFLVLLSVAIAVSRSLRQLELGDELALAHGIAVARSRIAAVVIAVGLTATTTAICGPIPFVALVAPQLARLGMRTSGLAVLPSALVGAMCLLSVDLLARLALSDVQMPVGALTACLGGAYFGWLLWRETKAGGS